MESNLVQCYNKGCGQKFDPNKNENNSCTYHPGPPYFHDAYKIWKCCDKKSTDFSTWLSYKGCTKSSHNGEKPANIVKQAAQTEIRPEKPEEVIVWNGLNKPAERNGRGPGGELHSLRIDVHEAARKALDEWTAQAAAAKENGAVSVGSPCQNNSCKATYGEGGEKDGNCYYHSGVAIFHEGMKYWTCCQKKTSNFSSFLDQIGCVTGAHCWVKYVKEHRFQSERVDKIREDWFSRSGFIHFNIYCRGAVPERCTFQTDGLRLRIQLMHGFGDKDTSLDYELWGEVVPQECHVEVFERKVELILKQKTVDSWPKLLYNRVDDKETADTGESA